MITLPPSRLPPPRSGNPAKGLPLLKRRATPSRTHRPTRQPTVRRLLPLPPADVPSGPHSPLLGGPIASDAAFSPASAWCGPPPSPVPDNVPLAAHTGQAPDLPAYEPAGYPAPLAPPRRSSTMTPVISGCSPVKTLPPRRSLWPAPSANKTLHPEAELSPCDAAPPSRARSAPLVTATWQGDSLVGARSAAEKLRPTGRRSCRAMKVSSRAPPEEEAVPPVVLIAAAGAAQVDTALDQHRPGTLRAVTVGMIPAEEMLLDSLDYGAKFADLWGTRAMKRCDQMTALAPPVTVQAEDTGKARSYRAFVAAFAIGGERVRTIPAPIFTLPAFCPVHVRIITQGDIVIQAARQAGRYPGGSCCESLARHELGKLPLQHTPGSPRVESWVLNFHGIPPHATEEILEPLRDLHQALPSRGQLLHV